MGVKRSSARTFVADVLSAPLHKVVAEDVTSQSVAGADGSTWSAATQPLWPAGPTSNSGAASAAAGTKNDSAAKAAAVRCNGSRRTSVADYMGRSLGNQ